MKSISFGVGQANMPARCWEPPSARVYVVAEAGRGTVVDAPNAVQFSLRPLEQLDGVEGRKGTWGPRLDEDEFVSDARYRCSRNVLPFTF